VSSGQFFVGGSQGEFEELALRITANFQALVFYIQEMAQQRKKKQPKRSDVLSEVKDVATKSSTSYDPTLANLFATSVSMGSQ